MKPAWSCGICTGDPARRAFVNAELVKNTPHTRIEEMSRTLGLNVKRETIRKHVNVCVVAGIHEIAIGTRTLGGKKSREAIDTAELSTNSLPSASPSLPYPVTSLPDTDDFATLVKSAAVERLKSGQLRVTTGDGLAAQAILDKRAERQKDRDVFTKIGMLLAGAASKAPPMIMEGEYVEVEAPLLEAG